MSGDDSDGKNHEVDAAEPVAESLAGQPLITTLVYGLSLPERATRSASAVVGGLIHETAARLIPAALRSSRSYSVFIQQALDMMIHDVGGVTNPLAPATEESKLARKAVGGLLDVAGTATLHLSPMAVLAIFCDVAYGSGYYLSQLSKELKREGIIDDVSSIDHVSDLIEALNAASGKAADAIDTPPINIQGMRETIDQLRSEINRVDPADIIPQVEINRMWTEMEQAAGRAKVGFRDVSATMTMFAMNRVSVTSRGALSTVMVAGNLLDQHIFSHYFDALDEIDRTGLYQTLAHVSGPYTNAVWENFAAGRATWTEELISGRLPGKAWDGVRGWRRDQTSEGTR